MFNSLINLIYSSQDLIGSLFVLLAGLSTLIGALLFGVDPSLVGLAVTYSLQVCPPFCKNQPLKTLDTFVIANISLLTTSISTYAQHNKSVIF